jgi:hypothetical protein
MHVNAVATSTLHAECLILVEEIGHRVFNEYPDGATAKLTFPNPVAGALS